MISIIIEIISFRMTPQNLNAFFNYDEFICGIIKGFKPDQLLLLILYGNLKVRE